MSMILTVAAIALIAFVATYTAVALPGGFLRDLIPGPARVTLFVAALVVAFLAPTIVGWVHTEPRSPILPGLGDFAIQCWHVLGLITGAVTAWKQHHR